MIAWKCFGVNFYNVQKTLFMLNFPKSEKTYDFGL